MLKKRAALEEAARSHLSTSYTLICSILWPQAPAHPQAHDLRGQRQQAYRRGRAATAQRPPSQSGQKGRARSVQGLSPDNGKGVKPGRNPAQTLFGLAYCVCFFFGSDIHNKPPAMPAQASPMMHNTQAGCSTIERALYSAATKKAKAAAPKSSPKPSSIAVRNVRRALCRRSCPSASSRSKKLMMSSARPFTRVLTCTGGTTRKARSPRQRPRAGLSQDSGAPVRPPARCRRSRPRKPCALYRPPFSGSVPVPFPAWRPCPRRPHHLFRREISPAFPSDRAGCSVHSATYPCFLHFFQP